ncbi:methionine/alanine import family NSS transporter small subunit, partial [Nocardiopsis alba]|uniref:methionine/alanine import family NSS transporter small subunit n=1 Tax=Nocardiopsis alba TaxID=53437 RepID=UPI0033DD619E
MSASAIVMMVISIVVLWGGLLGAVLHLRRHPDEPAERPDQTLRIRPRGGLPGPGGPPRTG